MPLLLLETDHIISVIDFFDKKEIRLDICFQKSIWLLVRGTLLMEWGTTQHESTWGGCKVTITMWVENGHAEWHLHSRGDNSPRKNEVDMRWEWPHEVRMVTQDDFCMVEGTSYTFSPKVISHPCEIAKWPQVTLDEMLPQWCPKCKWWRFSEISTYILLQSHFTWLFPSHIHLE